MAETFKVNGIKLDDGNVAEFIPPVPTESERGGLIAKEKDSNYTVEAQVGSNGKIYVPEYPKEEVIDSTLTESGQSADAKVVGDKFNAVDNSIEQLNRKKAPAIVESASGTTIVATDSSDDPFRGLTLKGYTEQVQTTGKNLLKNTATSLTTNGVTFTVNEDGSVTANGTSSASSACLLKVNTFELKANTSYILSGCPSNGSSTTWRIIFLKDGVAIVSDFGNGATYTPTEDETVTVRLDISAGSVEADFTFYPMIRYASIEDSTYEPYTGGAPSPSPDYPQELEDAGKWGNLCNLPDVETTINGIAWSCENGSVTAKGTATGDSNTVGVIYFDLPIVKGTYFVSGSTSEITVLFMVTKNGSSIYYSNDDVALDGTETMARVYCKVAGGKTVNATVYPMLNYGTTALPYRPYTGQKEIAVEVFGKNLSAAITAGQNIRGYTVKPDHDDASAVIVTGAASESRTFYIPVFQRSNGIWIKAGVPASVRIRKDGVSVSTGVRYVKRDGTIMYGWDTVADFDRCINYIYYQKYVNTGDTSLAGKYTVQLELGATATAYEPYKSPQQLIHTGSLPGIPLGTTIPDTIKNSPEHMAGVWFREADQQYYIGDTVDYEGGKYVQRILKRVLDGNEQFHIPSVYTGDNPLFQWSCNIATKRDCGMASHYKYIDYDKLWDSNDVGLGFSSAGSVRIKMDKNIANTVDELLAFLSENPVTIYSILATPIITDLPESELAAYKALHTNYPVTTVTNDCDVNMDVEYNADTKTWILNQINSVAASIVSNL